MEAESPPDTCHASGPASLLLRLRDTIGFISPLIGQKLNKTFDRDSAKRLSPWFNPSQLESNATLRAFVQTINKQIDKVWIGVDRCGWGCTSLSLTRQTDKINHCYFTSGRGEDLGIHSDSSPSRPKLKLKLKLIETEIEALLQIGVMSR